MMLTEILDYRLKEGTVTQFHDIMLSVSLPLHIKMGIDVILSGPTLASNNSYSLIRCFPSKDVMESTLAVFYASSAWQQGPRNEIVSLIESNHQILLPGRFEYSVIA